MTIGKYNKIDLATNQLETAIGLFVSGGDKFSVITLAGAADVILCQLVLNQKKENFTEYSLRISAIGSDVEETKESHGRAINDVLHINDLKHMDKHEDGLVVMDVEGCALAAIAKAIANYVILCESKPSFVQAFLAWGRLNLDPDKYNVYCDSNFKPKP